MEKDTDDSLPKVISKPTSEARLPYNLELADT